MQNRDLEHRIEALRSKLRTTGAADPELESLLRDLDRDIQALLARPEGGDALAPTNLGDRLRAVSVRFANRHPRLEPILEELANMLATIGI